jgi:septal ring factor EnvC (AmiA/AmiB activator)
VFAEAADVATRLSKIRLDVSATERSIENLKSEFNRLKKEERHLEDEIKKLSDEEERMLTASTQVLRRREGLLVDLRAAEQRVAQQQALIRERLRVLYMNSSVSERDLVLGASQSGQVERVAVYAGAMRRFDRFRFDQVSKAVEDLVNTRRELDQALDQGKVLQEGLQVKRNELEEQKGRLRGVIQQIQSKQQAAKRSLESLTSEAEKLEALLRVIMSADDRESVSDGATPTRPPEGAAEQKSQEANLATKSKSADVNLGAVMHPGGLFAQTARISYPVTGEIVQRFGKNRVTSFADMVFSKGVEYRTPEGSQVRSVLGGRVAFSGDMPGYGTVVIVDHGERTYSLYGRLGKSHVKQGDLVQRKDVIGVTSPSDSKGRNFYFETRKNGAPVDPVSVLSRAS